MVGIVTMQGQPPLVSECKSRPRLHDHHTTIRREIHAGWWPCVRPGFLLRCAVEEKHSRFLTLSS